MRKPDFFIVGAPKCGTTAMADYLGQHPDIYMCPRKDSTFFGSDLDFRNTIMLPEDMFRVDMDTYLSWFRDVKEELRVGEASVWYLYSKRAAYEIKEFSPDADIIVMLRNPIDMLYSLHGQFLYDMNEDIEDFEQALKAEKDRKKGLRIPKTAYLPEALFYRDVARYYEQVERYLEVFGRERVHIIIFEKFKENTKKVYKETLEFLGVSTDFEANFEIVNPSKTVRSKRVQKFIASPPGMLQPLARRLASINWLRWRVKSMLDLLNVRVSKRPPLPESQRRRLLEEFETEITRLSKLINMDLSCWLEV